MTYAEIAAELGFVQCSNCANPKIYHVGETTYNRQGQLVVHWRDRQIQVSGLKRFLTVVAEALAGHDWDGWPQWRVLHQRSIDSVKLAHRFGRRMPKRFYEEDRAKLRFLLHEIKPWDQRTWDHDTWTAYRRAERWAYRTLTATA